MPVPLRAFATPAGAQALNRAFSGIAPGEVDRIRTLIIRTLQKHPEMSGLGVNVAPGSNTAFNMSKDQVTLGDSNADALAHELGHAENLDRAKAYQTLLVAANGLLGLNKRLAMPVMLGIRAFVSDPAQRSDLLNTLAAANAAAAGPALMEEASASTNAIINSDDKIKAIKTLLPALGRHAVSDLMPTLLYQIARHTGT